MLEPAHLEALHAQDWDRIGRTLVLFVYRLCGIRGFQSGSHELALGLGKSAEDIVQDVIVKVLDGRRTWDPSRGALVPTLKQMVRSELDHLRNRDARQRETRAPEDPVACERQEGRVLDVDPNAVPEGPQALLERQSEIRSAQERVNRLLDAVQGDTELEDVIVAILDGCDPKAGRVAEHLQIPVKEIYGRLKRLRRVAKSTCA